MGDPPYDSRDRKGRLIVISQVHVICVGLSQARLNNTIVLISEVCSHCSKNDVRTVHLSKIVVTSLILSYYSKELFSLTQPVNHTHLCVTVESASQTTHGVTVYRTVLMAVMNLTVKVSLRLNL